MQYEARGVVIYNRIRAECYSSEIPNSEEMRNVISVLYTYKSTAEGAGQVSRSTDENSM